MAPFAQKRTPAHLNPEKNPEGRPSEYRQEYCEAVIEAMSRGLSLSAFAGKIKVARETVYRWMGEHREFSDAVARARSTRTLSLEEKLLRSRKGAETTAAIFALKNADPHEWRDMRQVTHEHNISLPNMSDEQLLAIAQGHGQAPMIDVTPGKKSKR